MTRELLITNWPFLLPIMVLSVTALGIVLERGAYFFRIRCLHKEGLSEIFQNLRRRPIRESLETLNKKDKSPEIILLKYALTSRFRSLPEFFRQRLAALKERAQDRLERRLSLLPGLANIATLMGLFGTVSGMITAFSRMTATGSSDPYVLAGGISRALVTTAAGLAAAIPALLAHHFLISIADRHGEAMEEVIVEVLALTGVSYVRERQKTKA